MACTCCRTGIRCGLGCGQIIGVGTTSSLSSTKNLGALSVRPEGWEKLTLNRCNFSHFLSIITPVKVEFLTLYVNNYTN